MFNRYKVGDLREYAEMGRGDLIDQALRKIKDLVPYRDDMQIALVIAAARNDVASGTLLLDYGADINYGIDIKGFADEVNKPRPPIFNAVECGSVEFLRLLLSRGANPNVFEHRGDSALLRAFYECEDQRKEEIIKILLANGADPRLSFLNTRSFLHVVVSRSKYNEKARSLVQILEDYYS